jgi:hypothetical protein
MPGTPKGLVLLCQQCGTGLPLIRTEAANTATQMLRVMRSAVRSQEVDLGGYAASRIRSWVK